MANKNITIKRSGFTLYIVAGSNKESFDFAWLSDDQIVEKVKWIIITGGMNASEATIKELLRENRVL